MVVGLCLMLFYMLKFKFNLFGPTTSADWWFGISPEGFGTVAMIVNVIISFTISRFTQEPPKEIQDMVENIRYPKGNIGKVIAD